MSFLDGKRFVENRQRNHSKVTGKPPRQPNETEFKIASGFRGKSIMNLESLVRKSKNTSGENNHQIIRFVMIEIIINSLSLHYKSSTPHCDLSEKLS